MKNAIQTSWQALIPVFFLLTALAPAPSGFSARPTPQVTCPAPDVTVTDRSSSSVSFAWDAVTEATVYKVWYYRSEDNYTSSETYTGSTAISYSNLPAGTYTFYICAVCTGGTSPAYIVEDLLMG